MSRGSFGRTVARAAASGGSRNYGARRPTGWYLLIAVVAVAGVFLVWYSRNEALHPSTAAKEGPTGTSNWFAAYEIDICGKAQPALAPDSTVAGLGLRTFGDGIIDIDPGAAGSAASSFEGAKATLAKFASSYPKLTLTATQLRLPSSGSKLYSNGDSCPASGGVAAGKAKVTIRVWSSPTAKTSKTYTSPSAVHLSNGEMITVAFVQKGVNIPQPASKTKLVQQIG